MNDIGFGPYKAPEHTGDQIAGGDRTEVGSKIIYRSTGVAPDASDYADLREGDTYIVQQLGDGQADEGHEIYTLLGVAPPSFRDDFERAESTWAGPGWIQNGDGSDIHEGRLRMTLPDQTVLREWSPDVYAVTEARIELDLDATGTIVAHASEDLATGYTITYRRSTGTDLVALRLLRNGVVIVNYSFVANPPAGGSMLRFVREDDALAVYVDGLHHFSAVDPGPALTGAFFGVANGPDADKTVYFDDFSVTGHDTRVWRRVYPDVIDGGAP